MTKLEHLSLSTFATGGTQGIQVNGSELVMAQAGSYYDYNFLTDKVTRVS